MEHHLFAVLGLDIQCIIRRIKPFFINLAYVPKRNVEVVEHLIFESLNAHMVELLALVARCKYYKSLFIDAYLSLDHC